MIGMLLFRFGGQAITFLIIALLARNLGPKQFGIYSTLTIFIGFCAILLAPGLNDLMIRESLNSTGSGKGKGKTNSDSLRTGYGLRLILTVASVLLAITVGPLMDWDGLSFGLIALAAVSLLTSLATPSFRTAYDVPLQLDYRMDRAAGINFAGRVILLSAIAIGVLSGANLTGIISAQIAGETIAFILLLALLSRARYPIRPDFNRAEIRAAALLALPLILAEALTITYTRLDVLLLNHFIDAREAGIFAGPVRIIDGLQIIPTIILGSLIPLLNRLKSGDSTMFERAVKLSARALWGCGIVCAVSIAPFSDSITRLFLGNEFSDSSPILRIGVFCAPLIFAGALLPAVLIINGQQKFIAIIFLFLAAINIGLNYYFIPKSGASGAIIAKLATYAALFPVALLWTPSRKIAWQLLIPGFIPFALSILAAFYIDKLNLSVAWGLPAIFILTASLIWFTGWFGSGSLKELKNTLIGRTSTELD